MRTVRLAPNDHDRALADVSHLPHLLAAALVAMQDDSALKLAEKASRSRRESPVATATSGATSSSTTPTTSALAWADCRPNHRRRSNAKTQNQTKLQQWLDAAAARRQKLLDQKLRELNSD